MDNNKEELRKAQNEVYNLELILRDILGMDVNVIPKFKNADSDLKSQKEKLEEQMFLSNLRKKEALDKQREQIKTEEQKQSNLSKALSEVHKGSTTISGTVVRPPLYKIIFRMREMLPVTITKNMYKNLYSKPVDSAGMLHGVDGDDMMSVRASDILTIVKI